MANRSRLSAFILIAIAIFQLNRPTLALANNDNTTNDEKITIYPQVAVHICNQLPGVLTTHYMSGNNDFGINTVPSNICETWNFRPNVWGTTIYLCAIESQQGRLRFNPYDTKRDFGNRCTTECNWSVKSDGVHGINHKTGAEDIFIVFFK